MVSMNTSRSRHATITTLKTVHWSSQVRWHDCKLVGTSGLGRRRVGTVMTHEARADAAFTRRVIGTGSELRR